MLTSFLRNIADRLGKQRIPYTQEERDRAEAENILYDNSQAFKQVEQIYKEGSVQADAKLQKAAARLRGDKPNPFQELEDLTNMRRDLRRG